MSKEAEKAAATMSEDAGGFVSMIGLAMIKALPVWVWGFGAILMFIFALSLPSTTVSVLSWLVGVLLVICLLFRLRYEHRRG